MDDRNRNYILIAVGVVAALCLGLGAIGSFFLLNSSNWNTPNYETTPLNEATQQAHIEEAVRGTATTSAMLTEIAVLYTQQAAQATAVAGATAVATQAPTQVPTQVPTATFPPFLTSTPTVVLPTATLAPPTLTFTPRPPTATATVSVPCNMAKFEGDVTIPDGTTFAPGTSFTKTWRLRNTGTCTWTTAYDLVFFSGSQMGGPAAVDLTTSVAPGQVVDLSVNLIAPAAAGSHRGNWKLRDSSGIVFGLGTTSAPFYVDIKVSTTALTAPVDMASQYCSAEWTSGGAALKCPGTEGDSAGYVVKIDKPVLETGYADDEPALLTVPKMVDGSMIQGKYPAIRIETGYDFSAVIGCAYNASGCDVKFQLDYQIGSGGIATLATWSEVYDGKFTNVNVDLSALAGKDVRLILTILSNGSSNNDRALWLAPRVNK